MPISSFDGGAKADTGGADRRSCAALAALRGDFMLEPLSGEHQRWAALWALGALLLACLATPARTGAQPAAGSQPGATSQPAATPATVPAIYDENADARAEIAAACGRARRENQRVLLMFGANWCGWCQKLHGLFKSDPGIARTLLYEYQLVLVDVGRFDKNQDLARKYEVDLKKAGVPFLTVLDGDGKVLANQETGALEKGAQHDPERVTEFLAKWKAEPLVAPKQVAGALARAVAEQKVVLLHVGAPWCLWCRRLDEFLARPEISEILGADAVDLKIDVDRMTDAAEVVKRFRKEAQGGIPWFAFVDAQGKVLTTSDGPKGNIGYPAEPEEISHFVAMLKQVARRISAEQIEKVERALKEAAPKR